MAAQSKTAFDFSEHYDETPYESYSYPASQVSQLWALGQLFGIDCAHFENARVLELGGASGGNIMTAAESFPNSTFVCVDYSKRQIEDGKRLVEESGIKNMNLHYMSIEDITPEFGEFDYIIAHGLMSWIPKELQPKVLEIIGQNLSPNGIAFVSYNTYPAWGFYERMRDMMIYHTAPIKEMGKPMNEVSAQAKSFVKFLAENNQSKDAGYTQFLQGEVDLLDKTQLFYVAHEYLEACNNPLWFKDFYRMAEKAGVQYVTDSNLPTAYVGNLKTKAQQALQGQGLEQTEQYIDFLLNRRFRQSIVCKAGVDVKRSLNPKVIENFYLTTSVQKLDKTADDGSVIYAARGMEFKVQAGPSLAMFEILLESGTQPMHAKVLIQKMAERAGIPEEEARKYLLGSGVQMVLHGGLNIHGHPGVYVSELSEKPYAPNLIRVQGSSMGWVNGRHFRPVKLKKNESILISYVDGNHTVDEICEKVHEHVKNGEITIARGGVALEASEVTREDVDYFTQQVLKGLMESHLFTA